SVRESRRPGDLDPGGHPSGADEKTGPDGVRIPGQAHVRAQGRPHPPHFRGPGPGRNRQDPRSALPPRRGRDRGNGRPRVHGGRPMTLESLASILFWPSTAANAAMLLGTAGNFFSAPRLEGRSGGPGAPVRPGRPKVSLLIPARDEEANLGVLLPLLKSMEYPDLEILILDDQS